MLRQSDGYLSGQQLCDHFQVSRTAVWKAINQLKEEGYEIEAVRNNGYRIVDIPDRITADAIKSCLETKRVPSAPPASPSALARLLVESISS